MVEIRIECTPLIGLLGYVKGVPPGSRKLVAMLLLLAKGRMAMVWGRRLAPKEKDWLQDAAYCSEQL